MKKKTLWITGGAVAAALVLGGTGAALAIAEPWDTDDDLVASQSDADGRLDDGDRSDDRPSSTTAPSTAQPDSDDLPVGDADRRSASEAALAEVGSGTVTDVDRDDDADHAWEVEVTKDDGTEVEVELDAAFAVVRVDQG